jgi:hypothetical protein
MNWKKIFKVDPIEYKQPQELYCANLNCLNEIAELSPMYQLLDDTGVQYALSYCFQCIVEGKTN